MNSQKSGDLEGLLWRVGDFSTFGAVVEGLHVDPCRDAEPRRGCQPHGAWRRSGLSVTRVEKRMALKWGVKGKHTT